MICRSVPVGKFVLLLCNSIALIICIIVNYLGVSNLATGMRIGLYEKWNNSVSWNLRGSATNSTFTPLGLGFTAWIVIYACQLVVVAHCWTTLCRKAPDNSGKLLCTDPDLAPAGLLFFHFLASLFNMTWIFLADRVDYYNYLMVPQVCVLFCIALSLAASLTSSYYWLAVGKDRLVSRQSAYWLVVILVQNGVGVYSGWTVFASFLNLDVTLTYVAKLTNETSSLICLALLNAVAATYVVLELTVLQRPLRFIFSPHAAIIWASGNSLANKFEGWTGSKILVLLLLCIMVAAWILKVIAACIRSRTDPIFPSKSYSLEKTFKA